MAKHPHAVTSKMQATLALGASFWNDSCDLRELRHAVDAGARGATSNPVIVAEAVSADPATWLPVVDTLLRDHPTAREDEIAWRLVGAMGREAAAILAPVHARTGGEHGWLCVQTDPRLFRDAERMCAHGREIAALAPNVAVKIPATAAGLQAIETLTGEGIRINGTVSFSFSQAVACAAAVERGLAAAERSGRGDAATIRPWVTLMVGRLDDHLRRVMERERVTVEPGLLDWAGIAVFKKSTALFRARGYRSTLLAAAYRHCLHWTELVGPGVVLSMPYRFWTQFDASELMPRMALDEPVDPRILSTLLARFPDFARAMSEDGLSPSEFETFGPSIHTLQQFHASFDRLVGIVRGRLLR